MNLCLQKPCPRGYAFHDIFEFQLDYFGGFRFDFLSTCVEVLVVSPVFVRSFTDFLKKHTIVSALQETYLE